MTVLRPAVSLLAAVCVCAVTAAQGQQKPPTIRTRIDLLQIDVTVLDSKGRPVRGLTQADFTLTEDGKPKEIKGFTPIDLPDDPIDLREPAWAETVSPDVTSNEIDSKRVFVLVLDDAMMMGSSRAPAWSIRQMKKDAAQFLEDLGPKDQAAIVFTNLRQYNQNLTADRAKLLRALAAYPDMDGAPMMPASCLAQLYQVRTIEGVVKELALLTDRRKSIVYFGGNLTLVCAKSPVRWIWRDVFALAQQHHVTINPVDTQGLRVPPSEGVYKVVAGETGGYAVFNSNDFAPGLKEVRARNSSYYLLAYDKPPDDGRFRQIRVRVNRPDVEVVTRSMYLSPKEEPEGERPPDPPESVVALAGLVPDSTLPLRASMAPFAADKGAVVALALGVRQPPMLVRTRETVDLLIRAFTVFGDPVSADAVDVPITVPASRDGAGASRYDVLARIEIEKPGRYEIRISAHSTTSNTHGSVYLDVEIPDFKNAPLSMSGVVLNAVPAHAPVAPLTALIDLTPIPPTTERTFGATDLVASFTRVYQGGRNPVASVAIRTSISNDEGAVLMDQKQDLAASAFGANRSAPLQFNLPISALKPGRYLFSIEATAGRATARRDVPFVIR